MAPKSFPIGCLKKRKRISTSDARRRYVTPPRSSPAQTYTRDEVLFVSPKDNITYLYVTDYTRRTDLVPVAFTVPRALQLQDRIVKIALRDDQGETAKQLKTGDFVAIRNLRLRPVGSEQKLMGGLGGSQRLLSKLQASSSNNHELQALVMYVFSIIVGTIAENDRSATGERRSLKRRRPP